MESEHRGMLISLRERPEASAPGMPSDRAVKATVVGRLRENPYTQDARIKVDVHDGVVHLGGEVPSPVVQHAAAEDAELVPGVITVDNELVVAA